MHRKFALNQLDYYGVKKHLVKLEDNESRISFAIVETTVEDHQSIIYRHKAADLFLNKKDIESANIKNYELIGWQTKDIYQNTAVTLLYSIKLNRFFFLHPFFPHLFLSLFPISIAIVFQTYCKLFSTFLISILVRIKLSGIKEILSIPSSTKNLAKSG